MKYKIVIEKYLEKEIEARTEDEAIDIVLDQWSQDDEVDIFVEKCEEEDE